MFPFLVTVGFTSSCFYKKLLLRWGEIRGMALLHPFISESVVDLGLLFIKPWTCSYQNYLNLT